MKVAFDLSSDSRRVAKGSIFVAIKGASFDGHNFINQAILNGASLIIGEKQQKDLKLNGTPYIRVNNSREAFSVLASMLYAYPAGKMKIIGVTGTDGKTTTASLIYWILKNAGKKVGLISTVAAKIGVRSYDTGFHITNPEPLELQKFLALMVQKGCKYAVLEVTSHGLDQGRVYGISFDVGVLTNITHEHLDYHKTFRNYVLAKQKLFEVSRIAIINRKYGKFIKSNGKRSLYNNKTLKGVLKKVVSDRFKEPYNVLNATAAILAVKEARVSDGRIIKAIKTFPGVEGRMQEIKNNKGIRIIVDFAHTPNALENVLRVLRNQLPRGNKLIAVFGCAGDRDTQKRPMMAEISSRLADISVFTAEDPRSEKIEDIISQMLKGVKAKNSSIYSIKDRKKAIFYTINNLAKKGDTVVICGKGHERSMNINGIEYTWLDSRIVKLALQN